MHTTFKIYANTPLRFNNKINIKERQNNKKRIYPEDIRMYQKIKQGLNSPPSQKKGKEKPSVY